MRKYASFDSATVLELKGSSEHRTASLDKLGDFDNYRTDDHYLYARIRAISSRVNKNHDGWPSVELAGGKDVFDKHKQSSDGFTVESKDGNKKYGFATFLGKPIFVDHNNSDPKRARGVIVDSKLRVLNSRESSLDSYYSSGGADPEHMPPTEIELLLEVDAKKFPKFAKAIKNGDLDGFSMGCFVAGTPITLHDGTKKAIENISINDLVITHTGQREHVTATMKKTYRGNLYHVETYGQATTMSLTEKHPVWTQRGWVEAKDLTKDDSVLTPTIKPEIKEPDRDFEKGWATLAGYYLAEGNLGYDKKRFPDGRPVSVEWSFHADEQDYIQEIKDSLEICGYKAAGPYIKNNCASIRCNSPDLAHWIQDDCGEHSWDKRIHYRFFTWGEESRKALVDSYLNGDGHERNGKIEVGTASETLATQMQALATTVGYRVTPPTKQHSPSAVAKRPKFSMYVTKQPTTEKRFSVDESGLWRKITNIRSEKYDGTVYNFDVGGDHSYVAADCAVHNCDVEYSKCSHCGNIAHNPDEYCSHIVSKGALHDYKTSDGKKTSRKSYENCFKPSFFEISGVFDPADETALAKEVRSSVNKEAIVFGPDGDGFDPNYQIPDPIPGRSWEGNQLPGDKDKRVDELAKQGFSPQEINEMVIDEAGQNWPGEWDGASEGQARPPGYEQGNGSAEGPGGYEDLESLGIKPYPKNIMGAPRETMPAHAPDYLKENHAELENKLDQRFDPRKRPTRNDATMSKTAEADLPQSFHTTAPEKVDTLRDEQICPVCGNDPMDGDKCDVCGYESPPEGFDNPDLTKAKEVEEDMEGKDSLIVDKDGDEKPDDPTANDELGNFSKENDGQEPKRPGSFLQSKTRNSGHSAMVTSEMLWQPKYDPHFAGRINQNEKPIRSTNKPATNGPLQPDVVKSPQKPVTAAMLNAQDLIWKAQQRKTTGDNMNTRTADGSTPPDASPDKRVDVTGVGGVIEPANDSASKADAQVDVTAIGTTGVTGVEADSTESLPTASEKSNDAGFNKDKTTEDSGPTKTFGDSDGSEKGITDTVTNESLEGNQNKGSSTRMALDSNPWPNDEIEGGSANKGTEPVDPIGKAQDRVDVLQPATTPDNNSGPTSQWTGTDGNGIYKQQDPVTNDVVWNNTDNAWTSHIIAAVRIADQEVELGMIDKDEKYNRMAELSQQTDEVLQNTEETLSRVKTAAYKAARTASAKRVPFALGKETSAGKTFERLASTEPDDVSQTEEQHDSGLFI